MLGPLRTTAGADIAAPEATTDARERLKLQLEEPRQPAHCQIDGLNLAVDCRSDLARGHITDLKTRKPVGVVTQLTKISSEHPLSAQTITALK